MLATKQLCGHRVTTISTTWNAIYVAQWLGITIDAIALAQCMYIARWANLWQIVRYVIWHCTNVGPITVCYQEFREALSYSKNETCDSTLYLNNVQIDIVSAEWRTNKTADVWEKSFDKRRMILRSEPVLVRNPNRRLRHFDFWMTFVLVKINCKHLKYSSRTSVGSSPAALQHEPSILKLDYINFRLAQYHRYNFGRFYR